MKKAASVSIVMILTVIILLYIQVQCYVPAQEQSQETQQDVCNNTAEENSFGNTEINGVRNTEDENGAESTEDRKSARASAESAAGKGDSCPLDEKYREVLLAYAEYIQKYCENIQYPHLKFDLVYIDADNIPELAIIPLPAHPDGVHICVYNDGAVVETGEFGSIGAFLFKPYENLIFSGFSNMGEGFASFYRIEGTESIELQTFHDWDDYFIEAGYEVDGVRVSEEEYNEAYGKWNTEEMLVCGYNDAVLMDGIDDLYGELCRRIFFVKGYSHTGEIFSAGSRHSVRGQYGDDSLVADNQVDDSCMEEWKQMPEYGQPLSVEEGLRKLETCLEQNLLEGMTFQASERAVCYYGACVVTTDFPEKYMIRVYKETADCDVCLEGTLLISSITGDIYVLEGDDYVLAVSGGMEGFAMSGEPRGFWVYEEGSMESKEHPEEEQNILTEVFCFLNEQEGMSNFKILYEGIYFALGRRYHHVSLIEDNEIQIHRLQTYCIDVENGNLYEVREDFLGVVTELHYMGKVSVE